MLRISGGKGKGYKLKISKLIIKNFGEFMATFSGFSPLLKKRIDLNMLDIVFDNQRFNNLLAVVWGGRSFYFY